MVFIYHLDVRDDDLASLTAARACGSGRPAIGRYRPRDRPIGLLASVNHAFSSIFFLAC